ncbi:MAG: heparinase II/III family protein [Lentisphaeria bacterium]|nr:heparinase II/III family protein [Lentisphaeria bacterium]
MKLAILTLCLAVATLRAATPIPLENPGFEEGSTGWLQVTSLCSFPVEAARTGKRGLRITDTSVEDGSDIVSPRFPATPGVTYAVRFWAKAVDDKNHLGVYLRFYDSQGRNLTSMNDNKEILLGMPSNKQWKQYTLCGKAPKGATAFCVWIHSIDGQTACMDFDDFELMALEKSEEHTITTSRISSFSFPEISEKRIRQLAAMLPASPRGMGAPISDREKWSALATRQEYKRVFQRAEKYLTTPIPDTSDELYLEYLENGNRNHYEDAYFLRTDMLVNLAMAECMENQGRFLPKLEEIIRAILAERSWVLPAHDGSLTNFHGTSLYADLGCSTRAAELAQADWFLQDRLPQELREAIRREIMRRAYIPYRNTIRNLEIQRGSSWMIATNNWNAVCTRNMVVVALNLVDDPLERAEILAAAEISAKFFVSGFTPDGYCSEGVGYWDYGFGYFMMMNEYILDATGGQLDLLAEFPSLKAVCEYAKNIMIDDGLAPYYADGGGNPGHGTLALIQRHYPELLRKRVSKFHPQNSLVAAACHLFQDDDACRERAPEKTVRDPRSYFDAAGVLICRLPKASAGHFGAAIKAGNNAEMHNHNDVGSYVIALDSIPLVLDPGGEVYTQRTFSPKRYESKMLNSYGHDVPIVAGKLQKPGAGARGIVTETRFSDEQDRMVIDMTSCYKVQELVKLTRTFVFDRKNPQVVITDEVDFSSPQTFQDAIVTYSPYDIASPDSLRIFQGKQALQVKIAVEGAESWSVTPETIENPGRRSPTRLAIDLPQPVLHAKVTITYTPQKEE